MTVGKWRQQVRMLHSIPILASGEKVINVALSAGYNSLAEPRRLLCRHFEKSWELRQAITVGIERIC